jgi:hypothetical protein
MLTCVMGLPVPLWVGMAFTSTLDLDTADSAAAGLLSFSFFPEAGALLAGSVEVVLCGMFLISL